MRAPLRPDRVAKRTGAAVDVQPGAIDAKVTLGDHGHDGERLVDLEEVDFSYAPAGALQTFLDGGHRRGGEEAGLMGVGGVTGDAGDDAHPQSARDGLPRHHQGRRPVTDRA